ncbi:transposase [Gemmiger formicilis]|uniref:transposase n=1 Tax=Gemmiger formicilis TaxID=745368 RepID=UPI00195E9406|nr:transposase [Gemmiger formicilis]MBM6916147.1 transposase [Gemmiger formicilis]
MASAGGKKRKYRDNTVKGKRRGSKWPAEIKTAALCDLLVNNNLSQVAARYGVPESTLRTWETEARKKGASEKRDLFAEAREARLREINHLAAAGARASVRYIQRRLELSARDAEIQEAITQRIDQAAGVTVDESGVQIGAQQHLDPAEKDLLEAMAGRHRPMGDFAAANYLRALVSVSDRAAKMLGEDVTEDDGLQVRVSLFEDEEGDGDT